MTDAIEEALCIDYTILRNHVRVLPDLKLTEKALATNRSGEPCDVTSLSLKQFGVEWLLEFVRGGAEAVLLKRRYAVMKDAAHGPGRGLRPLVLAP